MSRIKLKEQLLEKCRKKVLERVEHIQLAIEASKQTAGNETKSSSGDKYETTRAMMHLEMEKLYGQLHDAREDLRRVDQIPLTDMERVQSGSLVYTTIGVFFISLSMGKVNLAGDVYMLVSALTPMGKALRDKGPGDSVVVNSQSFSILEVY